MKKISFSTLKNINSGMSGLSDIEVQHQIKSYGPNDILESQDHPLRELAIETTKDPMIWFLIGASLVFILVNETKEALILFVAIVPLIFMDAFLHWRTQSATKSLKGRLSSKVQVLRNNIRKTINTNEIVPGDLVCLEPDLILPADGVLQDTSELQIDESALTGEALPIEKQSFKIDPFTLRDKDEVSLEEKHLGYAGTRVLTGRGYLRVLRTGIHTNYGQIVQTIISMPQERTPLQNSIDYLVKNFVVIAGFICLFLAVVRFYQGHGWLDALLSAATLAVAAIPEEFPVVFTFFLGVGVYRLAKHKALVRRAVSVENIGRVTYICADKTGTITRGQLVLSHVDPQPDQNMISENLLLQIARATANAGSVDPLDIAIENYAQNRNIKSNKVIKIFPFTEDRKQASAIVETENKKYLFIKGSPETILSKSKMTLDQKAFWENRILKWAKEGFKVIACAQKSLTGEDLLSSMEPQNDYQFCGLLVFQDPARPEVASAIKYCIQNKIGVLMITGDHPETARSIAQQIGLGAGKLNIVSAETEPGKWTEEQLFANPDFLLNLDVIARCTPLQKLNVVRALKKLGHLVAVTGDGVNDVPALKEANIGIAMGERGTKSAREVASIVLLDDNFNTLVTAIKEGRYLFASLKKSFQYLIYIHIPLVLTAALIPLMGYPILYMPIHIVWLELIIHPTALFAFQGLSSQSVIQAKTFFTKKEFLRIVLISMGFTFVTALSFILTIKENGDVSHARAKAMALLILWSGALASYESKLKTKTSFAIAFLTVLSAFLLIQIPYFNESLHLTSLHLSDWIECIGRVLIFILLLKLTERWK